MKFLMLQGCKGAAYARKLALRAARSRTWTTLDSESMISASNKRSSRIRCCSSVWYSSSEGQISVI